MLFRHPTQTEAIDIVAISRLAVCYSEAICRGEIDEAVQVYALDGVLASGTTEDAVGREAIAATIRNATTDFEFVFQTTHSGLVEVDGDRAWARFPTTEWAKRRDGSAIQFLGVYEDELVRQRDGWRFTRRYLHGLTLGRLDSFTSSRTHTLAPPRSR
jgi:ketosteroid isomerase-like protein